ncbi:FtsX-like permease family protein [Kitasatospora saccharophila]|uniref:FtsX-like permease family protein n=1 Tax=Kitasatospora saccharophila TaxID=407973 RepID=UPI003643C160
MIRLGLRLAVSGGREAWLRLLVTAAAVAVGVGLLLTTLAAVNAVHTQNGRYAWVNTGFAADAEAAPADREAAGTASGGDAPLWWMVRRDAFQGEQIGRVDVAPTGPTTALPPGVDRLPADGEYYLSPALAKLADAVPPEQLADRFGSHRIGILGKDALPGPDSLVALVGRTPQELSALDGATRVTRILTTPPDRCDDCPVGIQSDGVTLILTVVTGALVFPLLILIGTATRLSATQRERRFAAMRLVGATPRQVTAVSAVESALAAAAGVLLGFLPYLAVRGQVAAMSLTGYRFYTSDLALTLPQAAVVVLGVPLAAVVAARIALRRVQVSPLGVSRRVTPKPPRAWRVAPLLAGLAELVFLLVRHPESVPGQVRGYLSSFGLIMIGLVLSGPWLTGRAAALLARRTQRPAALIAARRLADNPTAGFRAVSGLVLALLVMTATIGIITTMTDERGRVEGGPQFDNVLIDYLSEGRTPEGLDRGAAPPAQPGFTTGLLAVPGVRATMLVHPLDQVVPVHAGDATEASEAVACPELDAVGVFGHCEPGAATAYLPSVLGASATTPTPRGPPRPTPPSNWRPCRW